MFAADDAPFRHPGLLHSADDLAFMRDKVHQHEEPWRTAWDKMQADKVSAMNYAAHPLATVVRGTKGNPDIGSTAMMRDSAAAYSQAIQWVVTGDAKHATKSIEILNSWSATLVSIEGHDQKLLAGLTAFKFCNAAEIVRGAEAGWAEGDIARFKKMMREIYLPLMQDFFPKANGNWDAAMINSVMSIAVFCDDRELFNKAVEYFRNGEGNGSIEHYVFSSGQCQESTRDQMHTQLGLGMLADACQVAWNQGVDLYGAADNRLAIGFEFTARYNLGEDVDAKGKISPIGRGIFRPIYERVYQHYVFVKHVEMLFTARVIEKSRPEGWHADHESWGTLTSVRNPELPTVSQPNTR